MALMVRLWLAQVLVAVARALDAIYVISSVLCTVSIIDC
jgi:hypothetical protein